MGEGDRRYVRTVRSSESYLVTQKGKKSFVVPPLKWVEVSETVLRFRTLRFNEGFVI